MDTESESDEALVRAVVAGDAGAYARLWRRIGRIVGRCLADTAALAPWVARHEPDLRQGFELMLVEDDYRVLRTFDGRARLTTWVHVVARRWFRRRAATLRRLELSPLDALGDRAADADERPDRSFARRERIDRVRAVIATLAPADRLLLALYYEQGLDASAIGPMLGISPSGVRMRKARLLAELAGRFEADERDV